MANAVINARFLSMAQIFDIDVNDAKDDCLKRIGFCNK